MFAHRYFAARMSAPRYFPPAGGGVAPAPSAGNYVQRVVGRTTRPEDFAKPKRVSRRKLREKIEEDYIIL